MARTLVLLTNYFPFHRGEEYLERELPHLVRDFKRILLVPTMRTRSMSQTRAVPNGVEVLEVFYEGGWRSKLEQIWTARGHHPDEGAGSIWRHPVHRLYEAYFEGRSRWVAERVGREVAAASIAPDDEVLVYSYWLYVTARVGQLLAAGELRDWAPKIVSRAHGYDINAAASPVKYLPARETLLRGLDGVFPVAEYSAARLASEHPEHAHKIQVRRLGAAPVPLAPNIAQDAHHIVTCSTIRPLKRLPLVAEAVAILRSEGLDVRWTHLGWGSEPYASKIRDECVRLLSSAVSFTGHIPNTAVSAWYSQQPLTAFVNVSTSEGVPVSIMEAMRAGLPIVATDVGGTRELLPERDRSSLLPAGVDAPALADALRAVLTQSREEFRAQSDRMVTEWAQRWDADRNYAEFASELARLASGGR